MFTNKSIVKKEVFVGESAMQPIRVSRGEVVGIGKFKIPRTEKFDYEIQLLSFLSIKDKDAEDSFISTCIHLHIDGYGKTEEEADRNMMKNSSFFLSQNFSKLSIEDAWDNLRDLFKSDDWSNELWNAYHEYQIQLSMEGQQMMDPAAELFSQLMELTKKEEELENWENDMKKTRKELENWENELENRIEMMGNVFTCLMYLMSKMRLAEGV